MTSTFVYQDAHSIVTLTAIYTFSDVVDNKQYVSVRVPFGESNFAVKLAGVPPCVADLAAISASKDKMTKIAQTLLKKIQTMLENRTFGGVLSETRMETLFEKLIGSTFEEIIMR